MAQKEYNAAWAKELSRLQKEASKAGKPFSFVKATKSLLGNPEGNIVSAAINADASPVIVALMLMEDPLLIKAEKEEDTPLTVAVNRNDTTMIKRIQRIAKSTVSLGVVGIKTSDVVLPVDKYSQAYKSFEAAQGKSLLKALLPLIPESALKKSNPVSAAIADGCPSSVVLALLSENPKLCQTGTNESLPRNVATDTQLAKAITAFERKAIETGKLSASFIQKKKSINVVPIDENRIKYTDYSTEVGQNALNSLPSIIQQYGLEKKGSNFNDVSGGKFRCPCCGDTLVLAPSSKYNRRWLIWGVERCPHFGQSKGGRSNMYSNDAIGIILAAKGLPQTADNWNSVAETFGQERKLTTEELNEMRINSAQKAENSRRLQAANLYRFYMSCKWGSEMGPDGFKLLASRGLDFNHLQPWTQLGLCVVKNVIVRKLSGNADEPDNNKNTYKVNGLGCALGNNAKVGEIEGLQIRIADDNMKFVPKDSKRTRFYTYGDSKLFNIEALKHQSEENVVVITEGPIDALSVEELLYDKAKNRTRGVVVSLQGCMNQADLKETMDVLIQEGLTGVVIPMMDSDKAGTEGMQRMVEGLKEHKEVKVLPFCGYLKYKDVNEFLMKDKAHASLHVKLVHSIGRALALNALTTEQADALVMDLANPTNSDKNIDDIYAKTREALNIAATIQNRQELKDRGISSVPVSPIKKIEEIIANANKAKKITRD